MQPNSDTPAPPPLPANLQPPKYEPPFTPPPRKRKRSGLKLALGLIFILFLGVCSLFGLITFIAMLPTGSFKFDSHFGEAVAVLDIDGAIMDPSSFRQQLERLKADSTIKAVVVRIESPGGAVGTSQEIYEELRRLDKDMPVVASMGNMAASGGYYAAMGTEYIFAYDGTVTGSIGVLMNLVNTESLLTKVGVELGSLTSGELKDVPSYTRTLSENEKQYLQSTVDNMYDQFLGAVIGSRKAELKTHMKEKIEDFYQLQLDEVSDELLEKYMREEVADGRIFTGRQALDNGLIDEVGTYSDAVLKAAELAGLDETAKVKKMKRTPSFLEAMSGETKALTQALAPEFSFQYRVRF